MIHDKKTKLNKRPRFFFEIHIDILQCTLFYNYNHKT